jgi:hypothetical protein
MGNNNVSSQVLNVTAQVAKPCPMVPPVIVSYVYAAPLGWNAVVCRAYCWNILNRIFFS